MSYDIRVSPEAERQLRQLAKKYRHIKQDLQPLVGALSNNPHLGDAIPGFADQTFKIRVASMDMTKGKSGGFRVITFVDDEKQIVWLAMIYTKAERENPDYVSLHELVVSLQATPPNPSLQPESN